MSAVNLVIGGGITGLYSAHILNKRDPQTPVIVLEAAPEIGGLLKSTTYEHAGTFDTGIHTMYETGTTEIDSYFKNLPIDWHFMSGYARDLGGAAWDSKINYNAPFLDLTAAPQREKIRAEIGAQIDTPAPLTPPCQNADAWLANHFGTTAKDKYFAPAIAARQFQPATQIHPLAAKIQGLCRLSIDNEEQVRANYRDAAYSARVGFPNQRTYPEDILTSKRTYYPKNIGMGAVMTAIANDLRARGVDIQTSSKLVWSRKSGGRISQAGVKAANGETNTLEVKSIVCAVPLPAVLFTIEDGKPPPQAFAPAHQTVICNLLVKPEPRHEGIYYIYFHGHDRLHRISFPFNYSKEDIEKRGGYPICAECIYPRGEDPSGTTQMVIDELIKSKVIGGKDDVTFSHAYTSNGGFPNLSTDNIAALTFYREFAKESRLENLHSVGVLSREDLFFQFDLIRHAHEVLAA